MDIEKIKEELCHVEEKTDDDLSYVVKILKDKINEIIDVLNSRRVMGQK